jgi:hypothetical protein
MSSACSATTCFSRLFSSCNSFIRVTWSTWIRGRFVTAQALAKLSLKYGRGGEPSEPERALSQRTGRSTTLE